MRAVVLRKPYDLVVSEVAPPEPAHDQVLVRVTNSGICGTDLKIFTGAMPATYPVIMGHEMAGEVLDGADGSRLRRGDRVLVDPVLYCGTCFDCRAGRTNLCPQGVVIGREVDGGFADFVVAPCSHVYPLPASIDSRTAPLIQVLTTVLHAQRRANVGQVPPPSTRSGRPELVAGRSGSAEPQSVAVIGLGVSGQLHVQLAKARGASPVIGITRSAWKRSVADRLGADVTAPAGADAVQAVRDATQGHGADVVIESTGMVKSIGDAIAMVRPGGTVVLFGIYTASEGQLPFYQLYYKEPAVISARAAMGDDFPESIDLVARGRIKLDPLVTQVLPVAELARALGMLESDADGRMKIILEN
jgi:2-desacetyl-2-hydroxyethyl bacteriochlorophyllide A dehydrogenase